MGNSSNTIVVNAKVEMTAASLQAVVANSKRLTTPDAKGHYRVDTADMVSEMISRFLLERDFESFVQDIANYPSPV